MRNNTAIVMALCLLGSVAFAQDAPKQDQKTTEQKAAPAEYKIPPEALKEANPVKPTPESVAHGKKWWNYDCAMCHGADGSGKGDLAVDMKLTLLDYRSPQALKDRTDGELFYIIKNGKGQMPAEGVRAKPDQLWDLVNYIRSLAKKEALEKGKEQARQ